MEFHYHDIRDVRHDFETGVLTAGDTVSALIGMGYDTPGACDICRDWYNTQADETVGEALVRSGE